VTIFPIRRVAVRVRDLPAPQAAPAIDAGRGDPRPIGLLVTCDANRTDAKVRQGAGAANFAALDPAVWGADAVHTCSVCNAPVDRELHQVWISRRVGTDVLPLLVNACSAACVAALSEPHTGYVPSPHRRPAHRTARQQMARTSQPDRRTRPARRHTGNLPGHLQRNDDLQTWPASVRTRPGSTRTDTGLRSRAHRAGGVCRGGSVPEHEGPSG
jgi:hypothetical protein